MPKIRTESAPSILSSTNPFGRVPSEMENCPAAVSMPEFVVASAFRLAKYEEIDGYLAEYESVAPHIREGSTILPLTLSAARCTRSVSACGSPSTHSPEGETLEKA